LELALVLKSAKRTLVLLFTMALFMACLFSSAVVLIPEELTKITRAVIYALAGGIILLVLCGALAGLWWLWHKARQASIIQPDPNGNFGLLPVKGGYKNLNLTGANEDAWAWGVWQYSTSRTSQPSIEQVPQLPTPKMITDDNQASNLMLEGKAKVLKL
jgi:hypothetical protein